MKIRRTINGKEAQKYCKGNGLTEYECIEKVIDNYEEEIESYSVLLDF